eukprot:GHVR01043118.1.p1 GENE.GHVR01043118.1~~GHVR01043118.1.p1  ORF type:complete len:224 (+),score=113.99 GHVR01043118.1:133-804(+)
MNKVNNDLCSFLFSGENNNVVTSDAGMYGECTKSSLLNVFTTLKDKYMLDKDSVFLDLGSGRGVPNLLAACNFPLLASIGVELDRNAYMLSVQNVMRSLKRLKESLNSNDTHTHTHTRTKPENISMQTHSQTHKHLGKSPKSLHYCGMHVDTHTYTHTHTPDDFDVQTAYEGVIAHTHTHTHTGDSGIHLASPRLYSIIIDIHTHTHTHIYIYIYIYIYNVVS